MFALPRHRLGRAAASGLRSGAVGVAKGRWPSVRCPIAQMKNTRGGGQAMTLASRSGLKATAAGQTAEVQASTRAPTRLTRQVNVACSSSKVVGALSLEWLAGTMGQAATPVGISSITVAASGIRWWCVKSLTRTRALHAGSTYGGQSVYLASGGPTAKMMTVVGLSAPMTAARTKSRRTTSSGCVRPLPPASTAFLRRRRI